MPVTARGGATRTAIITVDDDPGVSRAVARDLRRRYGEQHRIVRAESGQAALDALRQMKLRGDLVAVILADYRMPEMNGIEFLEQAMDVYPGARRVLLTVAAPQVAGDGPGYPGIVVNGQDRGAGAVRRWRGHACTGRVSASRLVHCMSPSYE